MMIGTSGRMAFALGRSSHPLIRWDCGRLTTGPSESRTCRAPCSPSVFTNEAYCRTLRGLSQVSHEMLAPIQGRYWRRQCVRGVGEGAERGFSCCSTAAITGDSAGERTCHCAASGGQSQGSPVAAGGGYGSERRQGGGTG